MRKPNETAPDVINPFARRPQAAGLSLGERVGVLAIYLGLALLVGHHVVRSIGTPPPVAAGRAVASK